MEDEAFSAGAMRPLSAREVLEIRRAALAAEGYDETERCLLGNAMVLAACCVGENGAVFADGQAVLSRLTPAQMERLLTRFLAQNEAEASGEAPRTETRNPAFDEARFRTLKEE